MQLNPNDASRTQHPWNAGDAFRAIPRPPLPHIERAMRLDPGFSQQYLHFLGLAHLLIGYYETAAAMFKERIRLVPETDTSRSISPPRSAISARSKKRDVSGPS